MHSSTVALRRCARTTKLNPNFPSSISGFDALRNKELSSAAQVVAFMGRLMRHQDLANATAHDSDHGAMKGPILTDVKFPDVLVAKVCSHDNKGRGIVLSRGKEAGGFKLALGD